MKVVKEMNDKAKADAESKKKADAEFKAWLAKYEPEERKILAARDHRRETSLIRDEKRRELIGALCDVTEGRSKAWTRRGVPGRQILEWLKDDPYGVVICLKYMRVEHTRRIKKLSDAARRPLYYERENARRRALASARRKVVKRHTVNPCPTREAILDAWQHRRDSHEATIRFGGLIMDLECYLDNTLIFNEDGAICGRRGGVKRWLQEYIPALFLCYTTVMRYKAAATKLRQITELSDPTPISAILSESVGALKRDYGAEKSFLPEGHGALSSDKSATNTVRDMSDGNDSTCGQDVVVNNRRMRTGSDKLDEGSDKLDAGSDKLDAGSDKLDACNDKLDEGSDNPDAGRNANSGNNTNSDYNAETELAILRARAIWLEVKKGIRERPSVLMARIDAMLDPENITDSTLLQSWRERYKNEITLRRKKSWRRRLFGARRSVG